MYYTLLAEHAHLVTRLLYLEWVRRGCHVYRLNLSDGRRIVLSLSSLGMLFCISVSGAATGLPTGNRKKLSSSQAQLGQATGCYLVSFHFLWAILWPHTVCILGLHPDKMTDIVLEPSDFPEDPSDRVKITFLVFLCFIVENIICSPNDRRFLEHNFGDWGRNGNQGLLMTSYKKLQIRQH